MANDEKLILHEKEHKELFFFPIGSPTTMLMPFNFTVPEHDSIAKKPKGIFNANMAIGAIVFGAIAFALAPAALATSAVAAITVGSAVVGGLLAGTTSNNLKNKRYNLAVEQKHQREELAKANGLSPEQAEIQIASEDSKKFQEMEQKRRAISKQSALIPSALL